MRAFLVALLLLVSSLAGADDVVGPNLHAGGGGEMVTPDTLLVRSFLYFDRDSPLVYDVTATFEWGDGSASTSRTAHFPVDPLAIGGFMVFPGEHRYDAPGSYTALFTFDAVGTNFHSEQTFDVVIVASHMPEPETYVMLLAGLGLMGLVVRRRKRV